jgi:hypothetical protein
LECSDVGGLLLHGTDNLLAETGVSAVDAETTPAPESTAMSARLILFERR